MPRPERIHVVGSSPRSGTTLAFELLTSCFRIEKFGDHEISLFERPERAASDYASKKPMDLVHVKRVIGWDKHLNCLFMDRDPRDIVVSQHGSRPGEYWCDFPAWERNQKLIADLQGHPRVHVCRYEDLVSDPDSAQAQIAAAFPFLQRTYNFSDFDKVSQSSQAAQLALKGVRKISAKSVGTWQQDLPRVAAQLRAYPRMAKAVVANGYADDIAWADVCADVAPNNVKSVRASHDLLRNKQGLSLHLALIRRRAASFSQEAGYVLRNLLG